MELHQLKSFVAVADSDPTRRELIVSGTGLGLMHANECEPLPAENKIAVWEKETMTVQARFAWNAGRENDPLVAAVRDCVVSIRHGDGEC